MIEKCSIGNMSYNIQNITLIILILILIIVIIYYLKNSSAKHDELIEKYTTPTDIKSDESYNTHNAIANSQRNSEFPTSGTEITLRDCQVQFNDKFDGYPNDTVRYVYEDGWQEIATLKEPGLNSTFKDVPIKIISRSNETNQDAITNYSERSKCFRKMSATDNKYRYQGNDLIQYRTGNNLTKGTHSQLNADGALENYMEMKFNLDPLKTSDYYNNLKTSICSLRYSNTLGGTSLGDKVLYRLTLNARNQITAINQITINSTNNHIFTVNLTTDLAALLTSSDRDISYQYNGTNFVYKDKLNNTGTQINGKNNIDVEIYTFNRELLCNRENEEKVKYQTIKSYKIIDNNKIDVNTILKATSGDVEAIIENTNFPGTATDQSYSSKDSLLTAIDERIKSEKDTANASVNTNIERYNRDITTTEGERNVFLTSINTKATFFDKIFDADTVEIRKTFLVSESGLISGLELNKLGYTTQDVSAYETILTTTQEPSFSIIKNNNEEDIYTIESYTDTSIPHTKTFDRETICSILIVGGGGGGGMNAGAGGGAGGLLFLESQKIPAGTKCTINVGNGGAGGTTWAVCTVASAGNDSSITINGITHTALGGGGGMNSGGYDSVNNKGANGGSGGGAAASSHDCTGNRAGGTGKSGQGYNGGGGYHPGGWERTGGGGGGAGEAGQNSQSSSKAGNGGVGRNMSSYFGTTFGAGGWFAGGGGGGVHGGTGGTGGTGGGGGENQVGVNGTGGGGGAARSGSGAGRKGGSGIVLIRYKNVPEQTGNENEKQITLKYENKPIFTYRTDESPYSWQEAYNEAIVNGKRMPTIKELRDYMNSSPTVFSAFDGNDVWIPVLNTGTTTGRDWVQAGNLYHTRGKSHTQDLGAYPTWGDNTTAAYAKVYFEAYDIYYRTTLPIKTTVNINGNTETLNAGTYNIRMNASESEITNYATNAFIGKYAHTDGNKLIFKYAMSRTLSQLHELSTTFSGTQYKSSRTDEKYLLGTKAINKITKYKIYIYKKHSVKHIIKLYAGDKELTYGTDYTTSGSNQETGAPTITLYNFYITINKTISGAIYLKSDNPIFYIDETSRTTFNNTTYAQFETNVNNLTDSGTRTSDNSTTTLARLNSMFGVTQATGAKTTEEGKLITYNITRPSGSHAQITIDFKSNPVSPVSRTSLDNLAIAYNTISGYSPQGSGGITPKLNANFGDILNSAPTDIDEYISYEFPSPPTDAQITPDNRTARFNIKSQATKYVYFKKKRGGANSN